MICKHNAGTLKCLSLLMCAVFVCTFCVIFIDQAKCAEVVDRIVAVVNDDIIILSELNQMLKPFADRVKALGYPPEKEREMLFKVRSDILEQLIDRKLADQEIKRFNITVSEKEIDNAIERVKEASSYTDEELREELNKQGLCMEEYRKGIEEQILRAKLVNFEIKSKIVITREDVKSYYEKHRDEYCGEKKFRLKNIIMNVPNFADEAGKKAIYKKMGAVLARLKAGEPFETVARDCLASSKSGELGIFGINELSPQLQGAIKGLKAGECTSVLDTDYGYQIFYISEIVDAVEKSLEEVLPEIEEKLYNEIVDEKYRSWLDEIYKRSHIKIIK